MSNEIVVYLEKKIESYLTFKGIAVHLLLFVVCLVLMYLNVVFLWSQDEFAFLFFSTGCPAGAGEWHRFKHVLGFGFMMPLCIAYFYFGCYGNRVMKTIEKNFPDGEL